MEFFRIHRTIPFMRHALVLNIISLVTFLAAVFFIITRGFHLSIEFTGGTVMEVSYAQTAQLDQVRTAIGTLGYTDFQVQNFGTSRDVMIRLPIAEGQTSATQSETVMGALKAADPAVELRRVEFVGPQIGQELLHNGLMALLVVVIGIMVYLGLRFEWKFAVAGVIANLHDVVIILGFSRSSSGSSRWRCWPGYWRCWATRSTNRSLSWTGSARTSASTARPRYRKSSTARSRRRSRAPSSPTARRR